MFIKNNIKKSNNIEKDENLNSEKIFFSILAVCLTVIIIINTIQLFDLIENLKNFNETFKTLSTTSKDSELQQEIKAHYITQLIKAVCILIAEISGLILCGYFANKSSIEKQNKPNDN